MSSHQNPLNVWVVAIVMVIAFGGALSLSRVLWKSAYSRSNMQPKSIPKQARKWSSCFVGFRCFGNASCSFRIALICMHVPSFSFHLHASSFHSAFISFSFHVPFSSIHFHSLSSHIHFIFIPMCIHVLSSSFHLHAISFQLAFMFFHVLSKVMEMALWLGQGTECNKWWSLSYR